MKPPKRLDSSNIPGGAVVNQMGMTEPEPKRLRKFSDSNFAQIRVGYSGLWKCAPKTDPPWGNLSA